MASGGLPTLRPQPHPRPQQLPPVPQRLRPVLQLQPVLQPVHQHQRQQQQRYKNDS